MNRKTVIKQLFRRIFSGTPRCLKVRPDTDLIAVCKLYQPPCVRRLTDPNPNYININMPYSISLQIQPIAVMLHLFALLICGLLAGFSGEKSMVFKCSSDDNTTLDIQVTGLLRRQRSKKWDNVVRQYWTRDKAAAVLSRH